MKKTISQMWDQFARHIPIAAPAAQRKEMKVAFYSAVYQVLVFQCDVIGDSSMSQTQGAQLMEDMMDEARKFLTQRVVSG